MRRGILALCLLLAACGHDETHPAAAPMSGDSVIHGRVILDGAAPLKHTIPGSSNLPDESMVVSDAGGVANVIVYIENAPGATFHRDRPVTLDQINCQYVPHVIALETGERLQIKSSDKLTHNVNMQSAVNPPKNFSFTGPGEQDIALSQAEPPFRVKCDVHPWMSAYIGVFSHPWFAVTATDGTFTIDHVPAGTWKLTAWQEALPTQSQDITVDGHNTIEVTLHLPAP